MSEAAEGPVFGPFGPEKQCKDVEMEPVDVRPGSPVLEAAAGLEENPEGEFCAICLEENIKLANKAVLNPCMHAFCTSCLREWLDGYRNNTCPVCKGEASSYLYEIREDGTHRQREIARHRIEDRWNEFAGPAMYAAGASSFLTPFGIAPYMDHVTYHRNVDENISFRRRQRSRRDGRNARWEGPGRDHESNHPFLLIDQRHLQDPSFPLYPEISHEMSQVSRTENPYYTRMRTMLQHRGERLRNSASLHTFNLPRELRWRRYIYEHQLRVEPPAYAMGAPNYHSSQARLERWVERELQLLTMSQELAVPIMHVIGLARANGLLGGRRNPTASLWELTDTERQAVNDLTPSLGSHATQFWREMRCFQLTRLNLETYDRTVIYRNGNGDVVGSGESLRMTNAGFPTQRPLSQPQPFRAPVETVFDDLHVSSDDEVDAAFGYGPGMRLEPAMPTQRRSARLSARQAAYSPSSYGPQPAILDNMGSSIPADVSSGTGHTSHAPPRRVGRSGNGLRLDDAEREAEDLDPEYLPPPQLQPTAIPTNMQRGTTITLRSSTNGQTSRHLGHRDSHLRLARDTEESLGQDVQRRHVQLPGSDNSEESARAYITGGPSRQPSQRPNQSQLFLRSMAQAGDQGNLSQNGTKRKHDTAAVDAPVLAPERPRRITRSTRSDAEQRRPRVSRWEPREDAPPAGADTRRRGGSVPLSHQQIPFLATQRLAEEFGVQYSGTAGGTRATAVSNGVGGNQTNAFPFGQPVGAARQDANRVAVQSSSSMQAIPVSSIEARIRFSGGPVLLGEAEYGRAASGVLRGREMGRANPGQTRGSGYSASDWTFRPRHRASPQNIVDEDDLANHTSLAPLPEEDLPTGGRPSSGGRSSSAPPSSTRSRRPSTTTHPHYHQRTRCEAAYHPLDDEVIDLCSESE